jgi:hypothetical protein
MIHVSTGNTKLGSIPSISLPPVKTCAPGVPCIKDCYARNIYKMYPNVRAQWDENLATWEENRMVYVDGVIEWLVENKPTHFRWHIGGDLPDWHYLQWVSAIARTFVNVKFMLFTKKYDLVVGKTFPENLCVILSMWPYLANPTADVKRAWVRGDPRAPDNTFVCKGTCDECLYCWSKVGNDLILKGH